MTLSNKSTTAYVVMATWADGTLAAWTYASKSFAEEMARMFRLKHPEAFIQIHRIEQRLPKEEK